MVEKKNIYMEEAVNNIVTDAQWWASIFVIHVPYGYVIELHDYDYTVVNSYLH